MSELEGLIRETRAAFQALAAYGSALHADFGVNASMRAVMEFIDENGPTPAPEIARAKNVSRQHIQNIVDQLIEGGFAEPRENPEHKRSSLIALTRAGKSTFTKIRHREQEALQDVARRMRGADIAGARRTLAALIEALDII